MGEKNKIFEPGIKSNKKKSKKLEKINKKNKKSKKLEKIKKKLFSLFFEETSGDLKQELNIDYETCNDTIGKEFIEKQFLKIFSKDQLELLEDNSLFFYYR